MAADVSLQEIKGDSWRRGLRPLLRRENRKWWHSRRWIVQTIIWVALLDGMLAFALYLLPSIASADGTTMSAEEALNVGQQMFFGLGVLALSIGAIVLLQDAIIEEKASGTAEWVLSKPASRIAFVIAKLLPNSLGMAVTMLLIPCLIGCALFYSFDPAAFTVSSYLAACAVLALHLFFYITLTLMLGVLFNTRPPLLGIALASLFAGSLIPVAAIVQFTPWKLGELAMLTMTGAALPPAAMTMLLSTAVWCVIFIAVAIWQFNRLEF